MQRVVLISDAQNVKASTIDFGCYVAELSNSEISVVLLNNAAIELASYKSSRLSYINNEEDEKGYPVIMDIEQTSQFIKKQCLKKGIKATVSLDNLSPSEETIYESRFADILILEPDLSFLGDGSEFPSNLVRHVLSKSECPVILAPDGFKYIDQIVFCYDGSASSLFAMKQFTYLFPGYKNTPVTLLEIRNSVIREMDESHNRTLKWLKTHYENADIIFLDGEVNDALFPFFLNKSNTFIVMGAFGRSTLSNLLWKSASEKIIKTVDLPLFIAHH